jgi:hypothetical protein
MDCGLWSAKTGFALARIKIRMSSVDKDRLGLEFMGEPRFRKKISGPGHRVIGFEAKVKKKRS